VKSGSARAGPSPKKQASADGARVFEDAMLAIQRVAGRELVRPIRRYLEDEGPRQVLERG
jgi:hypothetical protein